jgi:hypothetical protein
MAELMGFLGSQDPTLAEAIRTSSLASGAVEHRGAASSRAICRRWLLRCVRLLKRHRNHSEVSRP